MESSEATLSQSEKRSFLGLKLKNIYTKRLQVLRAKNDDCPLEKTEILRGRIREIKRILSDLDSSPAFELESDDTIDT